MRVEGKVAIIKGSQSGIGFATALRFAAEGAKVVVADIQDAQEVQSEMVRGGAEVLFIQVDVSDALQVHSLVQETVAGYGCLDVLVTLLNMKKATPLAKRKAGLRCTGHDPRAP